MKKTIGEEQLVAKAFLYKFLSVALHEPEKSLLVLLEDNDAYNQLEQAAELLLEEEGLGLIKEIRQLMISAPVDQENLLLKLRIEYTRLFLGPAPPPCLPYQSVYDKDRPTEEQGTILGTTAEDMEKILRNEGLNIEIDYKVYPDHIAIQLECMYHFLVMALEKEKYEKYIKKASKFTKAHLEWMVEFGELINTESKHPFYRLVGNLLSKTIGATKFDN